MRKTMFMETTMIDPRKTAAEVTTLLVEAGARHITLEYDAAGKITGLDFWLLVETTPHLFKLPVRTEPIYQYFLARLKKKHGSFIPAQYKERDQIQAERVAWRQLLRWIQAQLAIVSTGMVVTHELFLPFMRDQNGKTVFEHFVETQFTALPAPEKMP